MDQLFTLPDIAVPAFIVAAISVIFVGIGKAGFGGGIGIIAVPMMSLAIPPDRSIGIMLPLLCACDAFSVYPYRKDFDRRSIILLLPGAVLGILLGALTLRYLLGNGSGDGVNESLSRHSERGLQIFIGAVSIGFVFYEFVRRRVMETMYKFQPGARTGWLFGLGAGFSSTLAHAAGPVVSMFVLPQRFDRKRFVGTTVWFFTIINAIKLIPYSMQNLFDLHLSLWLVPFAPLGVFLGLWMNHRVNERWFHRIIYTLLFLTGLKLLCPPEWFDLSMLLTGGNPV